jgi:phenylpyruvate tautomerase PptA (4-oxalocrotonate tautomerase family)
MPILDVEVVGGLAAKVRRGLPSRIAEAAGAVFQAPPMHTWVRLRVLPRADYGESGGGPPAGAKPVFVSVLKRKRPGPRALAREVKALTLAVARATGRPAENVHVIYRPPAGGRAAFGGHLVDP